ncbi:helix-turn-helix domain-containing protein [uncultured Methanobrevibacter sp.]|uniref:MarR family transcriptional regulator n=1 Tax=uncultured Methanobrevibacter sp. TaxID=253161 RepID=UPI0026E0B382|nr:helix-turn-helix domain-containing protein [uncultured Methanobrevibacter sp.]
MNNVMSKKELWTIVGYLEVSSARKKTIQSIGDEKYKLPSNICKETGLTSSQVSNALRDLKNKGLVICLNESVSKGRLYKCTDLGLKILEKLK